MVDKITLANLLNLQNETTAVNTINSNNSLITTALNNSLSRDGTTPNQMTNSLDMNSNQIINLPAPTSTSSPARLLDVVSNPTIVIPGTGTSGHTVPYLDTNVTFSGNVAFTGGVSGLRKTISSTLNVYVDVTLGNDANDGLAPGSGRALKTIQKGISLVTSFDLYGQSALINIADGTYPENIALVPYIGRSGQGHNTGPIIIRGNTGNMNAVVIQPPSGNCFTAVQTGGFEWDLQYMKLIAPAAAIYADVGSWVCVDNINFGTCGAQHMLAVGGLIEPVGNYTISGNTQYHLFIGSQGRILFGGNIVVTITGAPAFTSFMQAADLAYASVQVTSTTFSGACTGKRYDISNNSVINTGGGGATFFPGTIAGTVTNGGILA